MLTNIVLSSIQWCSVSSRPHTPSIWAFVSLVATHHFGIGHILCGWPTLEQGTDSIGMYRTKFGYLLVMLLLILHLLYISGKVRHCGGIATVEPPNKEHFGGNNFVPCREVVRILEVK